MRTRGGDRAGTAAVLLVFCVFAVSVLLVLTLGADVYREMNESSREGYEERVSLSYIWSKVKNTDGGFYVGEFGGKPALCFDAYYGNTLYRTVIYCHDGVLRELFFEDGLEFPLGEGEPVARVESLTFSGGPNGSVWAVAGEEKLLLNAGTGGGS